MEWFTGALPKILTIAGLIVIFLWQIKKGYFNGLRTYVKSCRPALPLKVLVPSGIFFVGLLLIDPFLLKTLQSFRNSVADSIATFGGTIGKNIHPWMFPVGLYLAGVLARKGKVTQIAFGSLFAGVLAAFLSWVLKFTFLRTRPYGDLGPLSFFNVEGLFEDARLYQSFSSGDVAVVAGIAFYFFMKLKQFKARWLLVLLPVSTAFSRIMANKHWPSDGVLAIILGFAAAYFVYRYEIAVFNRKTVFFHE